MPKAKQPKSAKKGTTLKAATKQSQDKLPVLTLAVATGN